MVVTENNNTYSNVYLHVNFAECWQEGDQSGDNNQHEFISSKYYKTKRWTQDEANKDGGRNEAKEKEWRSRSQAKTCYEP